MAKSIVSYVRRHHIGLLALMVALGGTAYAANTVSSSDVVDDSLRSKDIKNDRVKGRDVAHDSLKGTHIDEATLDNDVSSATVIGEGAETKLLDADGFTAVEKTATGTYELTLAEGAPGCNFATSMLTNLGSATAGGGSVSLASLGGQKITAVVRDGAGAPIDLDDGGVLGFQIIGTC